MNVIPGIEKVFFVIVQLIAMASLACGVAIVATTGIIHLYRESRKLLKGKTE